LYRIPTTYAGNKTFTYNSGIRSRYSLPIVIEVFLKFTEDLIMSLQDRVKATTKNIEGKVQETVGDLTGDPKAQLEGQEKQAEAKVSHIIENVKDEVRKIID
jgi:uncharacterized protein YjbJ (UPF0337 family)